MATTTKKTTAKKAAAKKTTAKKAAAPKAAAKKATASKAKSTQPTMSEQEKQMMVAIHAYHKWEAAGCPGGQDFQHWIEAEAEVEAMLK